MRLFYLSEHRSCFNYQLRYESGFSRYELTAHEEGRIDNDGCFCVLFVLKGEVLVELGREHTISVHANRMLLIPQREENPLDGHHPGRMPPAVLEQGNNGVRQDVFRFHFS